MPIDTSIYQMVGRGVKSVADYDAERMQGEQNKLARQFDLMKMEDLQRGREESNTLAEAYRGAYGADGKIDRNALYSTLATRGAGAKIPGLQKTFNEADKAQTDAQAAQIKLAVDKISLVGQILGGVTDQATYDGARATAQANGLDVSKMPPAFDPQFVAAKLNEAMDTKLKLEQKWKQMEYTTPKAGDVLQANTSRDNNRDTNATSSANNAANNARMAQEGAANRGVQLRSQNLVSERAREANDLKRQELSGERASGGPVLGVPVPTLTPWANQSNPKDANKVKAAEISRGAKEIEKDVDSATKAKETARKAERFIELNKKTSTGGVTDKLGVTRWAQGIGSDYAEMESITDSIAPSMRETGSGSSSDMDIKMFKNATVSVDKPGEANKNIAKAIIANAQQLQDYADFRQTYLEQNGTLQGADRHWKDYANKNPIFDPAKASTYELNAKRKPWTEHFKQSTSKAPAAPAAQGGLSAAEQAELKALREKLGKK